MRRVKLYTSWKVLASVMIVSYVPMCGCMSLKCAHVRLYQYVFMRANEWPESQVIYYYDHTNHAQKLQNIMPVLKMMNSTMLFFTMKMFKTTIKGL